MSLILSIFLAIILSIIPSVGVNPQPKEDLRLSVSVISDTHIKEDDIISKTVFEKGLQDMINSPVKSDALVISGDLTDLAKKDEIKTFFDTLSANSPSENWILATGNHDTTRVEDYPIEEARDLFLKNYNECTGSDIQNYYYRKTVNGYTFIVLADERNDDSVPVFIGDEQLEFLDTELAKATADGKPAFVVCHYPLIGVNGQSKIDLVVFDEEGSAKIKSVMEKYNNVFMITGHIHTGINGGIGDNVRGFSHVETINGVTYVSLPAFGSLNLYGIIGYGNGYRMEVYDDEVIFRARNFVTDKWHTFSDFVVPLV